MPVAHFWRRAVRDIDQGQVFHPGGDAKTGAAFDIQRL
jgi:hypothetical protein